MQPSQDNCDDMVKKLEKGSNLTTSAPQQGQSKRKSLVQVKKSNMGQKGSTSLMQPKNKTKPSRKEKQRAKTKACFKCKEKGHLIAECPVLQNETRSDLTHQIGHPRLVRPVGVQAAQPHSFKSKQSRIQM